MTGADPVASARPRLLFLDSMRGLAAMYVLLFHSLTISVPGDPASFSPPLRVLRAVFGYGHFAVCVFIVLSGFSLMLPLAHAGTTRVTDVGRYLRRRCRRIMPPYYAALALSILAILGASLVPGASTTARDDVTDGGAVLSHLLLIHNWNFDWAFALNGPMWSVATEWQIYFLFPLVLLPLWRVIGPLPTVLLTWTLAFALHFVVPASYNFYWAAPWFVGSFAVGMWGASVCFSPTGPLRGLEAVPWNWVAWGSLGVLTVALFASGGAQPLPVFDAIVSVLALAWILSCVRHHASNATTASVPEHGERGFRVTMHRLLTSRPLCLLGAFSYSIYLLQHPLLRFTEAVLGQSSLSAEAILWTQLVIGTPLILAASWVFAQFFEFPFTSGSYLLGVLRNAPLPWNRVSDATLTPATAQVGEQESR